MKVEIKHGSTQYLLSNIHKEALSKRGDVFVGGVLSEMIDHQEDFVPYHNRSTLKQIEDYRSNNPCHELSIDANSNCSEYRFTR